MADEVLEKLRIELKDGLTAAVLKNVVDDLRREDVLNKDATEEILQRTRARPDQARDLIDSVQVKGKRASETFFISLKKNDKSLYDELNIDRRLEEASPRRAATSSVPRATPDKRKLGGGSKVEDFYKMDSIPRGHCVIINNENFTDPKKKRKGSHFDAASLEKVFTFLGFEVRIHNDLRADEIKSLMMNYSKDDLHKHSDCFVCCVLSHGGKQGICGKDGKTCSLKDIGSPFDAVDSLIGKPKVFFIQACRGCEMQRKVLQADDLGGAQGSDTVLDKHSIASGSDFLMAMSTAEGCYSMRDEKAGSWFIQSLCKYLKDGSEQGHDILKILTQVNNDVSRREGLVEINKRLVDAKMVPEPHFTLTKTLIFRVPEVPASNKAIACWSM